MISDDISNNFTLQALNAYTLLFMRLALIFVFFANCSFAQVGMGEWRLHIPSLNAIDIVSTDDGVFTAYENGISEYNFASGELSIWDAVNSLSDISMSCLGKCNSNNSIFVGYENGNVDKIKDNTVTNIPAIKLAQVQGSKKIHKFVEHEGNMYLATGFAIVKIDPEKNEVRDTYYPTNGNGAIVDLTFRNDTLFALSNDRLYIGNLSNPALADPAQWSVDSRVPILTGNKYAEIEGYKNEIYITQIVDGFGFDTVHILTPSSLGVAFTESFSMEISGIDVVDGYLNLCYFDGALLYNESYSPVAVLNEYTFSFPNPHALVKANGRYYIADGFSGLVEFNSATDNKKLQIIGPPKNTFYAMNWKAGKLVIAGGGLNEVFNTFNGAGLYTFEDESWSLQDGGNVDNWNGQNIWDYVSCSIDPRTSNRVAVGTYSELPLTVLDETGTNTVYTPGNSLLEFTSLGNGWSYLSALEYDDLGNLWILNGYANEPLKSLDKDGVWHSFDLGTSAKSKFTKKMVIDYNGNKWLSISGVGLYGYKDNATISDNSDDDYVLLNSGTSSGALPSNEVTAIAVDFDNEIWIGTDNGFAVLYNSSEAFDASAGDYNAQRIKLEYEGNVEYVLGATHITDIEVDGGNRKWFATANSGVILMSPDGLEIIRQFTTDNSPLISDNVLDLEIDQSSGEVYMITDKGLISYRSDASYEDPEYSNVVVFPNPARPDYDGPITIQGIRYDSDIKITDVAGNLVYQTTSNGGTATWGGKTLDGQKVSTGVYLIWTAANEGKGRFVGKVLVVN